MKTLMSGIALGESPRWHAGRLWFADWGTREIVAVDDAGASEVMLRVPSVRGSGADPVTSGPFCFDWLPDGRLLVVSGRDGLLLRQEPDGSLATHADLGRLSGHPWNDIVVDARGNAYVGNAGFAFPTGDFAPGILALVTPDGAVRPVADGVSFPNGVAVARDGATLLLAESYGNRITAFDVEPDGTLSGRRVWADLRGGFPDGICIDADDAVWYGDVANARCVRVREGGQVLQTIALDRGCFACMLGGADGRTLYMLAAEWSGPAGMADGRRTGQLLSVAAPAPHAGRP